MKLLAVLALAAVLSSAAAQPVAEGPSSELPTVADLAMSTPELSTLLAAVKVAGLAEALSSEAPITVLAPTNEAFATVLAALNITPAQLLSDPAVVRALLLNHVVPGAARAADLRDGQSLTTLLGGKIAVKVQGSAVTFTSDTGRTAMVITADIPASNGVVHIISGVLTPTTSEAGAVVPSAELIGVPSME